MDKRIIKGLIDEKLEIIQEQFAIIKEYEGKIPVIEIDLLMSNIRDIYELFVTLQQENQGIRNITASGRPPAILGFEPVLETKPETGSLPPVATMEKEPVAPVAHAEPEAVAIPEPEPALATEPEPVTPSEPEPFTPPVPRPVFPADPEPVSNPEPERVIPHHPEVHESKPPKTAFDLFSEGSHSTLADRLRDSSEKRVADRLQENKVLDLRTTIGINDKFLFINELFDGNMRIYDEGVNKLNECQTLAQADLLLLDLKIVYNWDSESPTVKKFVDLVRRKF